MAWFARIMPGFLDWTPFLRIAFHSLKNCESQIWGDPRKIAEIHENRVVLRIDSCESIRVANRRAIYGQTCKPGLLFSTYHSAGAAKAPPSTVAALSSENGYDRPESRSGGHGFSGGVRARFRVRFQAVQVPIVGGFPEPNQKGNHLIALLKWISFGWVRFGGNPIWTGLVHAKVRVHICMSFLGFLSLQGQEAESIYDLGCSDVVCELSRERAIFQIGLQGEVLIQAQELYKSFFSNWLCPHLSFLCAACFFSWCLHWTLSSDKSSLVLSLVVLSGFCCGAGAHNSRTGKLNEEGKCSHGIWPE